MGAGTMRSDGDPDKYGVHVYDTGVMAHMMMMTPNGRGQAEEDAE